MRRPKMKRWNVVALCLPAALLVGCASLIDDGAARLGYEASEPGHGAVAYSSSTREWRIVNNAGTTLDAERQAREACGTACTVVLSFGPGECGTLALNEIGGHAFAAGQTPAAAEDLAKARCQSTGRTCRVAPAQCNHGA